MFVFNRSLNKRITAAIAGVITIVGLTTYINVVKETDTGESADRNIECFGSSSGSSVCIRETGSIVGSGDLIIGGNMSGNTLVISNSSGGSLTGDDLCISTGSNTLCVCGSCD